jgi:hypothetical protein
MDEKGELIMLQQKVEKLENILKTHTLGLKDVDCVFFKKGTCRNGVDCQYKHTQVPIIKECVFFKKGTCRNGVDCQYKHTQVHHLKETFCLNLVKYPECIKKDCKSTNHNRDQVLKFVETEKGKALYDKFTKICQPILKPVEPQGFVDDKVKHDFCFSFMANNGEKCRIKGCERSHERELFVMTCEKYPGLKNAFDVYMDGKQKIVNKT